MTLIEATPYNSEDRTVIVRNKATGKATYRGIIKSYEILSVNEDTNEASVQIVWADDLSKRFLEPSLIDIYIGAKIILETQVLERMIEEEGDEIGTKTEATGSGYLWEIITSLELLKKK